jgi:hypothetical protein
MMEAEIWRLSDVKANGIYLICEKSDGLLHVMQAVG